ncbi:hypothetical protein B9479_005477 [Cryptococcus floricola]|uniref:Uncharacterized protein n=1 Tax=Cryptococcus floricola TaxID=2591691 RepID=A0A5D3AT19_9TREE|nr:hypothetical protein B9479_005477 [Cryptococcus floricola]
MSSFFETYENQPYSEDFLHTLFGSPAASYTSSDDSLSLPTTIAPSAVFNLPPPTPPTPPAPGTSRYAE